MPRDDTSPPSGPPWTPAGSSFRAVLLGTQASQVGARGVPGEQSGRRPGLRDTKAVSSKGPLGRCYEGLPLSVGLGNWKQAPADKRFLTLDPQQRSGAVGITLLAGVHGTRPPWRGLGGTLLPARQASGASEASLPGCRSMCRPPLDPIGRSSASRTRAWWRRMRAGRSRSRGACGAGAGLG